MSPESIRLAPSQPGRRVLGLVLAASFMMLAGCVQRGITPIRTHFNKGVYHYAEGDFEAAIYHYRQAVEENAADHRARFNLAEALERRATRLELGGAAADAEALRKEAEEHYRSILSSEPGHLRATVNLAAREHHSGDADAARQRLRDAIERYPRAPLPRISLATQSFALDDAGALEESIELLKGALKHDPDNLDANVLLGHAHSHLARLVGAEPHIENARHAYKRALEISDTDIGTLLALARLEHDANRPSQAENLLRRALYVRSDLLEAHLLLAGILADGDRLEEATAHLWRARQLEDPTSPRLAAGDYSTRLLDLYQRLGDAERAAAKQP